MRHKKFVEESIENLLAQGCIEELSEMPYCCNPLTVAEPTGKKLRLVLDLRHVNENLEFPKFKYENLKTASKHFEKDQYFITFDLKSGYHHVPIHKDDQKFLGFCWTFPDGKTRFFRFVVLPFGLASACYAFTKVLRPLIKKWRAQGIRCTVYLDDGICMAKTFALTLQQAKIIENDLIQAGFTINYEKSFLIPSQTGSWLGFDIDTTSMKFFVPEQKIHSLLDMIYMVLERKTIDAKTISQISGKLISMSFAIGPLTRLFTRQMYRFIESRVSWNQIRIIDDLLRSELNFWANNLCSSNGFSIKTNQVTSKIVYSDASETGYGGYVAEKLGKVIAKGNFSSFESAESSTYRELLAVKRIIESLSSELQGERVLWYSDNQNVARIISVGSRKPVLHELSIDIFNLCMRFDISIQPSWIPREDNVFADYLSKSKDTDDWGIDLESFEYIQSKFGLFTFDRF